MTTCVRADGISMFPKRAYAPRLCVTCGKPIERPTRTQLSHGGECKKQRLNAKQRKWKARQKGAE